MRASPSRRIVRSMVSLFTRALIRSPNSELTPLNSLRPDKPPSGVCLCCLFHDATNTCSVSSIHRPRGGKCVTPKSPISYCTLCACGSSPDFQVWGRQERGYSDTIFPGVPFTMKSDIRTSKNRGCTSTYHAYLGAHPTHSHPPIANSHTQPHKSSPNISIWIYKSALGV